MKNSFEYLFNRTLETSFSLSIYFDTKIIYIYSFKWGRNILQRKLHFELSTKKKQKSRTLNRNLFATLSKEGRKVGY